MQVKYKKESATDYIDDTSGRISGGPHTIDALTPGTKYNIKVVAYNSASGENGAESAVLTASTGMSTVIFIPV
mgnify:FL=1